jgi:hypothetical protein
MCVCVYIYVCMYVCILHIYARMFFCSMLVCACIDTCVHICMEIYVCNIIVYVYSMYAGLCVCVCVLACGTLMHIYAHIYVQHVYPSSIVCLCMHLFHPKFNI